MHKTIWKITCIILRIVWLKLGEIDWIKKIWSYQWYDRKRFIKYFYSQTDNLLLLLPFLFIILLSTIINLISPSPRFSSSFFMYVTNLISKTIAVLILDFSYQPKQIRNNIMGHMRWTEKKIQKKKKISHFKHLSLS